MASKGSARRDARVPTVQALFCAAVLAFDVSAQSQQPSERRPETIGPQQSTENPKSDSKNDTQAAKTDLRGTKQSPLVVEALPSEHTHTKTDEEKQREKDKAHEDRIIALSTFALAIVTALLAAFTLGLMIFTGKLWSATQKLVIAADSTARQQALDMRESLAIAEDAADAATRNAATAESALLVGQRAYVLFDWFDASQPQDMADLSAVIIPTWKNAGLTPAKNAIAHVNVAAFDGALPDEFQFDDLGDTEQIPFTVGANEPFSAATRGGPRN